jgi:ADP-ribose pyrophosphatase YjhB (NUDIX family)
MLIKMAGIFWKFIPRDARTWLTRRLHPTFTVSAAGIITNERGQVLLLDHVLRPVSGWGVPGGFMNKGEQPAAALRREIREETGLELSDIAINRCRTHGRHIEIIMTARGIGEAKVNSREIKQLGWFEIDNMPGDMSLDQQFLIRGALLNEDQSEVLTS